ncbi:SAM-dependent methyltransferase [Saccharopolyspora sp. K220]|uniref:SAM-dependent methyltransferase n=1 Tax=Saccharopolyspora soli TaxID=2926618 RepID=UPI001F593B10|nr:SAM-dependent methyltransferase [Saccharopolyspora soli]MCI2421777.1 SAM-dependent methyltransferase [Saccharopolyspora soli]
MSEHAKLPQDLDPDRPSGARIYDFFLGGSSNFTSDRMLARRVLAVAPDMRRNAVANRACLHRVVRMCLAAGVRQFLDIGCGIPTIGTPHEVAQRLDPSARVVYVDNEPVAVTHGELVLAGNPNAAIVRADLRDTEEVLTADATRRLLDFDRPVAVLMFAVLHHISDRDDPAGTLRSYLAALAPGSFLALTHLTADHAPEAMRAVTELLLDSQHPGTPRSKAYLESLLDGLELLEPGVVPIAEWRPEHGDADLATAAPLGYAAVARKP